MSFNNGPSDALFLVDFWMRYFSDFVESEGVLNMDAECQRFCRVFVLLGNRETNEMRKNAGWCKGQSGHELLDG